MYNSLFPDEGGTKQKLIAFTAGLHNKSIKNQSRLFDVP